MSHMVKSEKAADNPYNPKTEMQADWDRLRFVADFAQANLKTMRVGDKLNLKEDLFAFANAVVYAPDVKPPAETAVLIYQMSAQDISEKDLELLQAEFLKILRAATLLQTGAPGPQSVAVMPRIEFYVDEDHKKQIVIRPGGAVGDILLYRLMQLLEPKSNLLNRLQRCPECKRIFVKVKRQKYCSQRCSNRSYMREYRAIGGESDANHKQYEKRKEAKTGKPVNAVKRPRKKQ